MGGACALAMRTMSTNGAGAADVGALDDDDDDDEEPLVYEWDAMTRWW